MALRTKKVTVKQLKGVQDGLIAYRLVDKKKIVKEGSLWSVYEDDKLIVENADGCIDTIVDTITIIETFEMPDIFSPNNDGWNDQLMAKNIGICNFHISIFNRWGELVYETTNPSVAWDGKTKSGQDASEGTYYYVIKGASCEDEAFSYDQHKYVTLIRNQD